MNNLSPPPVLRQMGATTVGLSAVFLASQAESQDAPTLHICARRSPSSMPV